MRSMVRGSALDFDGPMLLFSQVHYYCPGDVVGENDINVLENEYTFTELQKFQTYVFRVAAYNANGPGVATDDVFCRTYSDGKTDLFLPELSNQNHIRNP